MRNEFNYVYSCDVDADMTIKIGTLEGELPRRCHEQVLRDPMLQFSAVWQQHFAEMCVEARVFSGEEQMALPVNTSHKAFINRWNWNEWLTLPVRYSDLPIDAQLRFDVFAPHSPQKRFHVGHASLSVFASDGTLNQGLHDLRLVSDDVVEPILSDTELARRAFPDLAEPQNEENSCSFIDQHQETDPSVTQQNSPCSSDQSSPTTSRPFRECSVSTISQEMTRLSMLAKRHRNGHLPQLDWLDRLTFREIELINEREKRRDCCLYLMVEFPTLMHADDLQVNMVYFETGAEIQASPPHVDSISPVVTDTLHPVMDFEAGQENLLELKHHHLARSLRSGLTDRDLKPDSDTRHQLAAVLATPLALVSSRDGQDLIWKYRFYLSSQSKALSKFLKCVNWDQTSESQQALQLMTRWAPIEPHQALELLGPDFPHPAVRAYAVSRLQQAQDEELLMYLLQLVQALRYESEESIYAGLNVSPQQSRRFCLLHHEGSGSLGAVSGSTSTGSGSAPVVPQSHPSGSPEVGSAPSPTIMTPATACPSCIETSSSYRSTSHLLHDSLSLRVPLPVSDGGSSPPTRRASSPTPPSSGGTSPGSEPCDDQLFQSCDLSSFLIARACRNSRVANYFYWYMLIECEEADDLTKQDLRVRKRYLAVMKRFSAALSRGGKHCHVKRDVLLRQQVFIDKLVKLFKAVCRDSGNRRKKIEKMQAFLSDPDSFKFDFCTFDPLPLPLDPDVQICGILPDKTSLFKSALMPARLTFRTVSGSEYVAIFKYGDDLRQDQLILQIIMLMDRLLKRENLDLKLTPYKVLATSSKYGFVQYVDSVAVAEVLNSEGSIQNYFRRHHPCPSAPFGVSPEVMDTYIKSCAGYCVITYLLGVGDRHLDNLLLTSSGHLFHVDFGYILGRDPKPLPPPMKLSKEMVEAMGGVNSEHYQAFRKQCYTAFLHLRRHASVILHLFCLMVDANIPDIALEPDKTVRKLYDKFRLDLCDEEAVAYMQNMIDVSVSAVMAALVEQLHKFAQYWRK